MRSAGAAASLVGVTHDDGPAEAEKLAGKLANLRVLADDDGVMNRSVLEAGAAVLVVSQFTLYGDTVQGPATELDPRRPARARRAARRRGGRRRCGRPGWSRWPRGASAPTWPSSSSTTARSPCCSRSERPQHHTRLVTDTINAMTPTPIAQGPTSLPPPVSLPVVGGPDSPSAVADAGGGDRGGRGERVEGRDRLRRDGRPHRDLPDGGARRRQHAQPGWRAPADEPRPPPRVEAAGRGRPARRRVVRQRAPRSCRRERPPRCTEVAPGHEHVGHLARTRQVDEHPGGSREGPRSRDRWS